MLTRERAEQIFKQVLKFSTADETEAMMSSTSYSLTRFANNTIHQNVQEERSYLSVRAVAGQRTARASTNRFDETSIRQAAEAALELARTQPPDPDLLPMPAPQTYRAVNRSYGETAELTPKARAETVKIAIARAEKDQLTAAGIFSSGASAFGLFNSRGLAAFHEETLSEVAVTVRGPTSPGWARRTSPRAPERHAAAVADRPAVSAAQRIRRSADEYRHGREQVERRGDGGLDRARPARDAPLVYSRSGPLPKNPYGHDARWDFFYRRGQSPPRGPELAL